MSAFTWSPKNVAAYLAKATTLYVLCPLAATAGFVSMAAHAIFTYLHPAPQPALVTIASAIVMFAGGYGFYRLTRRPPPKLQP